MKAKHLTTPLITSTISVFLIVLFVAQAPAVQGWRESNHLEGWQIWIEAAHFDRRDKKKDVQLKKGQEVKKLAKQAKEKGEFWSEDILIALHGGTFAEYDFKSPVEGKAYICTRVMDFRGGGQSWFVALNSQVAADQAGGDSLIMDTQGFWGWPLAKDVAQSAAPKPLKKGKNFIYVNSREASPGLETLMDVIMVSTTPFPPPYKEVFDNARGRGALRGALAVGPSGKLATVWGALKRDF